jgi:hypothetical protein
MRENTSRGNVKGFGFVPVVAACRFIPQGSNGACVLTHAFGVTSVVRTGAGAYTVTLDEGRGRAVFPQATAMPSDANYHEVNITAVNETAGTFTLVHKTGTFASMTGTAASDTGATGGINVLVYGVES